MQQLCLYVEITHDFSNIFYATVVKGGINVCYKGYGIYTRKQGAWGKVWYLMISISDICTLTYFDSLLVFLKEFLNRFKPSSKMFY